jgi:hypothetical protein
MFVGGALGFFLDNTIPGFKQHLTIPGLESFSTPLNRFQQVFKKSLTITLTIPSFKNFQIMSKTLNNPGF